MPVTQACTAELNIVDENETNLHGIIWPATYLSNIPPHVTPAFTSELNTVEEERNVHGTVLPATYLSNIPMPATPGFTAGLNSSKGYSWIMSMPFAGWLDNWHGHHTSLLRQTLPWLSLQMPALNKS